ncbi:MAG: Ca-activated chloride channel family protein, partial [Planctomycetota bacterium]
MLQFENPWYFASLGFLVPLVLYWHWRSYADLRPGRKRLATALRLAGLGMMVMALARPVLMLENTERSVLFLIDVSESIQPAALESAWEDIQAALEARKDGEQAGVVLFGRTPSLVVAPTKDGIELADELKRKIFHKAEKARIRTRVQELERSDLNEETEAELVELQGHLDEIEAFREELGVDGTDLEAACRLARGLLPSESRRRVMLYSDGNVNRGELLRELTELERAGFTAHAGLLDRGEEPEVVAEELILPAQAQVLAPFTVELVIQANQATEATVHIYRNKFLVGTKEIQLKLGRNVLELDRVTLEAGFHEFEAVVEAALDTKLENNVARAVVSVAGKPKVLLIEREEREARYLAEALDGEGIDVEIRPESGVPTELNDLLNYEVLILSDIAATSFAPGAMEAVKTYVRDMGGGLVMLGGEHSFGLGGYYRTPIEDALPVKMPIKKNIEKPNLALVLVIDKSGSMGGHKIELAKEAAIASAEVLKGTDRFGVVAFDGRAEWISPITSSTDAGAINGNISRLVAGGGTNIYPALYEAYQALLDEDAKIKHMILLSDGQTQGSGYDTLLGHIA